MRMEICRNVKNGVTELLTSNFSTAHNAELFLSCVAIMATFKEYFEYRDLATCCGIRNVHFMGTLDDWKLLRHKIEQLSNFTVPKTYWDSDFGSYIDGLLPIIDQFIETYQGNVNNQFWNKVMDVNH
jgi:hypothetical protein